MIPPNKNPAYFAEEASPLQNRLKLSSD